MGVHNLTNLTTHLKTKRRRCATLTPGESEAAPMLGTLWITPYVSLHPGAHLALLKKMVIITVALSKSNVHLPNN